MYFSIHEACFDTRYATIVSFQCWWILQINVETQRGFVPIDEQMKVKDKDGNVVFFNILFHSICIPYYHSILLVGPSIIRFLTCIALVMQTAR